MSQKITKENVGIAYKQITTKLDALELENKIFAYSTKTKYLPKLGYIHSMNMNQIVETKKYLDDQVGNSLSTVMDSLGIKSDELEQNPNNLILGIKLDYWINDLKTRIEEIRYEKTMANLANDKRVLSKYLTSGDLFELDMINNLSSSFSFDLETSAV